MNLGDLWPPKTVPISTFCIAFHTFIVGEWVPPSVLWRCWLGSRKGIRPVKNWVVGCWCGYLGWGADLHMAQQMPLPLTISCSSKSRLVLLHGFYLSGTCSPGWSWTNSRRAVKRLCVCVFIVGEFRDFKFVAEFDHIKSQPANGKPSLKGSWTRHVTSFKFLVF